MYAHGSGTIAILLGSLAVACGGQATEGHAQAVGGAGGMGGGPLSTCSVASSHACSFTLVDRPDLPEEERWGTLAGSDQFAAECPPTACGDAMYDLDHSGCATVAADSVRSEFSACTLRYLEQFRWPCAADQRVRIYASCTTQ